MSKAVEKYYRTSLPLKQCDILHDKANWRLYIILVLLCQSLRFVRKNFIFNSQTNQTNVCVSVCRCVCGSKVQLCVVTGGVQDALNSSLQLSVEQRHSDCESILTNNKHRKLYWSMIDHRFSHQNCLKVCLVSLPSSWCRAEPPGG